MKDTSSPREEKKSTKNEDFPSQNSSELNIPSRNEVNSKEININKAPYVDSDNLSSLL